MKVVANRKALLAAALVARKFQERELIESSPVYGRLLLEVDGGELTVTAAGLFTWYQAPVAAEVESDGEALVPAWELIEILRASREVDVALTTTSTDTVAVTVGNGSGWLRGGDLGGEFPRWPWESGWGGEVLVELPFPTLRRLLSKVEHAIEPDPKKFKVNAARLSLGGDLLELAATTGHRLVLASLAAGLAIDDGFAAMVPHGVVARLGTLKSECSARLLEHEGYLLLSLSSGERICFRGADLAAFPDTAKIEKAQKKSAVVTVDRLALLAAARRAHVASGLGGVVLEIVSAELLEVKSAENKYGRFAERLAARIEGGGKVSLNPSYLADALAVNEADEVEVVFDRAGEGGTVLVRPVVSGRSIERHREYIAKLATPEAGDKEAA